jgi:hypothetical protein
MADIEQQARELLALCLGERGFPCEAENVRAGEDLKGYEGELQAIAQLLRLGLCAAIPTTLSTVKPPRDLRTKLREDV